MSHGKEPLNLIAGGRRSLKKRSERSCSQRGPIDLEARSSRGGLIPRILLPTGKSGVQKSSAVMRKVNWMSVPGGKKRPWRLRGTRKAPAREDPMLPGKKGKNEVTS